MNPTARRPPWAPARRETNADVVNRWQDAARKVVGSGATVTDGPPSAGAYDAVRKSATRKVAEAVRSAMGNRFAPLTAEEVVAIVSEEIAREVTES
jgi:hypothetical protein